MEDLKILAAQTALNKMFRQTYFDICTVDSVAAMLNVTPPSEPYRMLRTLHCVHYGDMPEQLKIALPGLIRDCLSVEPNFSFAQKAMPVLREAVVEPEPAKRGGLLRLLGRS